MDANDPFLGLWRLDPTQSQYQFGSPPKQGTYLLELEGEGIKVTMAWETAENQQLQQVYHSIPDGKDYPYESPVVDAISMTRIDANTLDTTAKKEGKVIAHGRRVLSPDSQTMTITQSGYTPDGTWYNNLSVYHKQ